MAIACVECPATIEAVVEAGRFTRVETHAPAIANVAPCDVRDTNIECGKEMFEHAMQNEEPPSLDELKPN